MSEEMQGTKVFPNERDKRTKAGTYTSLHHPSYCSKFTLPFFFSHDFKASLVSITVESRMAQTYQISSRTVQVPFAGYLSHVPPSY